MTSGLGGLGVCSVALGSYAVITVIHLLHNYCLRKFWIVESRMPPRAKCHIIRPRLRSNEMQPSNKLCNIVVTDCTNQSHYISEIYNVNLYQFTDFLNTPGKTLVLTLR